MLIHLNGRRLVITAKAKDFPKSSSDLGRRLLWRDEALQIKATKLNPRRVPIVGRCPAVTP